MLLLFGERTAAQKVAFVELDHPSQVGFIGRNGRVDLVAVEGHLRFQAQRVSRAQAAGLDAELLACIENPIPDTLGLIGFYVDFKTVLAGVAGSRDARLLAADFAV